MANLIQGIDVEAVHAYEGRTYSEYQDLLESQRAKTWRICNGWTKAGRCEMVAKEILSRLDHIARTLPQSDSYKNKLLAVLMYEVLEKVDERCQANIISQLNRCLPVINQHYKTKALQKESDKKLDALKRRFFDEKILGKVDANEPHYYDWIEQLHTFFVENRKKNVSNMYTCSLILMDEDMQGDQALDFVAYLNSTNLPVDDIRSLGKIANYIPLAGLSNLVPGKTEALIKLLAFSRDKMPDLLKIIQNLHTQEQRAILIDQLCIFKEKLEYSGRFESFIGKLNGIPENEIVNLVTILNLYGVEGYYHMDEFMEIVQANPGAVQSIVELLSVVPGKMKALIEILNLPGSVDAVPKLLDLLKLAPDMAQKEILIDQIRYLFKRFAGTPTLPSLDEYLSKFQIMPENERFGFVSIVNELLHSHKYGPAETLDHYILAFAGCSAEERMILTNQVKLFLDNCGIDTNPYKALKFILKIPVGRRNDFIDQSSDLPKNALSHEIDLWFCFLFPGGEEQTRIDQSRAARDHIQTLDIQEQVALMLQARRLYDGLSALEANPVRAVTLLHGAEAIPEDQRETFIEQLPGLVAQVNQLQGRQNSTKLKVLLFIFRRMAPGDRADFIQHLCQLTTPYLMEHLEELLALPADQRADRVMLLSLQHQQFEDENGLPPRTLTINPADFSAEESNPTRPLLQLFEEINGHQRFPRMQYEGSDGMDVGGVTRDFVSKVFQALCHPDQKGLPLKETDNRYLPKIEEGLPQALSIDEQIKCCKAIGMLFARAINGDVSLPKGSVTTGAHFDSIMFSMIHALTLGELNSISDSLEGDSIQGIKLKLTKLYLKAQYPNMFKPEGVEENVIDEEIANLMNGVVSERLGDNGVETTFLQDFGVNSVVQATLVIAKSMHKHLISPDQWATIIGNSPEVLRTKIEGSLTADLVVNAFGLQNEAADTRKGMVKRWILEASDEALRDFVYSITGSTSLAPGQTLRVDLHESLNNPENAPVFHTCGQYMDIANYATYELLKEKLEISIASAIVGGFQLA